MVCLPIDRTAIMMAGSCLDYGGMLVISGARLRNREAGREATVISSAGTAFERCPLALGRNDGLCGLGGSRGQGVGPARRCVRTRWSKSGR